ncbi:DEAD/DEAH box helicase family protein [Nocardioides sp. W3-2-3]|uniref:DEAD/DEAH box helicase family protein n=1 Tax=Nocardioides convexus TaxID=2712224 RepID=UPI002418AEEB|nr:DEAD/DEAH box helicase family protein [Nocardioides convexus]NHA01933.1 DEAD/DEAH box helicase family protein [Nocardioides convexus]
MTRNERETREQLIDPLLTAAGWTAGLVEEEYTYKKGRLRLLGEQTVRDEPQFVDYVLRAEPRGTILAAVEAKDETHAPGAGIQQALAYAYDVNAPFAFSSNGHEIVEQDLRTGEVRRLDQFPTPDESAHPVAVDSHLAGTGCDLAVGAAGVQPTSAACVCPARRPVYAVLPRARCHRGDRADSARSPQGTAVARDRDREDFHRVQLRLQSLLASGYAKRVLFIADRVSLRDQAYNEFGGLGDRRGAVVGGSVPLERDVHFAIYQSLYADAPGGGRLYEQYPRDFFDVVIIDECHRSGYGDWSAILDHFDSAFHLGMTATPKQSDSVDTYAHFAAENLDDDGQPRPIYEYSLGKGIDDGFLATYKVMRVSTSVDDGLVIRDEVERGAETHRA